MLVILVVAVGGSTRPIGAQREESIDVLSDPEALADIRVADRGCAANSVTRGADAPTH